MSVVLQISDPHFGTEVPEVVEALARLASALGPDLVVLSGDITQRARARQFEAARAFTDRIGAPLLAVPGNHDIPLMNLWARLTRPYSHHCASFGESLEPSFENRELLVLGVNTTRSRRHKNGEVDAAQVRRVSDRLSRAGTHQLRVVVVHQPIEVKRPQDEPDRLIGHAAAQHAWAVAGADIVMGGHIHLPYVMPLPGLARPMWAVQAGTAVSSRVRRGVPNSVNVLRWSAGDGTCVVEQWDHAGPKQAFELRQATRLNMARNN
ncbi:metallophosphoesterase family protein [Hydrogenophaga sp.]|uniref:metallophosphoesterase family protein n=1 Tax=Hydrogenophaga sp. TaxID=1904254 RepID=UPI003F725515